MIQLNEPAAATCAKNVRIVGLLLNYRNAAYSTRCILSLLEGGVHRVLVWDNSEDEGSSAAAIAKTFNGDNRVFIEVSAINLGFAAGVNRGLERCSIMDENAWVLLLNNDATLLPGALDRLVVALVKNPRAIIAFPKINHSGRVIGWINYHKLTGLLSTRRLAGTFPYVSGCCMLIAVDRSPGRLFDEDFFMYGEDWELGFRWSAHPHRWAYVDQVLVEHEGSVSSGVGSVFYEEHTVAAHLLMTGKSARTATLIPFYSGKLFTLLVRACVRSLRYRSAVPLKALVSGARKAWRVSHR